MNLKGKLNYDKFNKVCYKDVYVSYYIVFK